MPPSPLHFAPALDDREAWYSRRQPPPERHRTHFLRNESECGQRFPARANLMAGRDLDEPPFLGRSTRQYVAHTAQVHPRVVAPMDPRHGHIDRRHVTASVFQEHEPVLDRVQSRVIHVGYDPD